MALIAGGLALLFMRPGNRTVPVPGTLSITVAPWGRLTHVKDNAGRPVLSVPEPGELTPTRLSLPPGSYFVTVRGPVHGSDVELSASVTIRSAQDTPLRLTLPGFDVEELIRFYVP